MGIEIERKFLVNREKYDVIVNRHNPNYVERIEQYYISLDPEVRLRLVGKSGKNIGCFLTVKTDGNLKRNEIEVSIPYTEYCNYYKEMIGYVIRKFRIRVSLDNGLWGEVDVYINFDLQIVEVEFKSEEDANNFIIPDWFGQEVTYDKRYKNKNIAINKGIIK